METSSVFLRWRAWAFACISFLSLLWIILLCIVAYARWELSDRVERVFIVVILLTNTINLIALPILIIQEFRPWLDAARLLFLCTANFGVAAFFTYWNPKFQCPTTTDDSQGICQLINMYILMANWVNPALLLIYSGCLTFLVWWRSRYAVLTAQITIKDEEAYIETKPPMAPFTLPNMKARKALRPLKPLTITIPDAPGGYTLKNPTRDCDTWEREVYNIKERKESSAGQTPVTAKPQKSARLSKQQRFPPGTIL